MNPRYAPGGDIYATIAMQYGPAAADRVWRAHESGRSGAVAEELSRLRFGSPSETSIGRIFFEQIISDPFGAPLEGANRGIGNVLGSALRGLFSNPWVLLVVIVAAAIYFWPFLSRVRR